MQLTQSECRHEFKYLISTAQIPLLRNRIEAVMQRDPHTGENGSYQIRSVYFDDYYDKGFSENENGTDPREKFRVRIYNHSVQKIALECKRKDHGMTRKTSCPLTFAQSELLLQGVPLPECGNLLPLQRKLALEMRTRMMKPKIIVEYERIPYVYKNGNVRVTFDTNIASSSDFTNFFSPALQKRSVMPVGLQLLEVKFDEYLPDFIYDSLNLGQLQRIAYSKYYMCRKYKLPK